MLIFLIEFMLIYVDFYWILGGQEGCAGAGSKALFSLLGPRWAQEPPRAHQDPSKRLPRASKSPPRRPWGQMVGRFLIDFGCMFDRFWVDFWSIVDRLLVDIILDPCFNPRLSGWLDELFKLVGLACLVHWLLYQAQSRDCRRHLYSSG